MIYRLFFKLVVLARLDAEHAHRLGCLVLRCVNAVPPLGSAIRRLLAPRGHELTVTTLGRTFPSPVGLAAGFDKDATSYAGLAMLGFGYIEVGTVTAQAQEGRPRPRIWRLPQARAVVNSMGFPNSGADKFAKRLPVRGSSTVIGVNIGKSKSVSPEAALDDYRYTVLAVAGRADYLALNVSSPNTPGLRKMQGPAILKELAEAVREALDGIAISVPTLVKIAPDLSDAEIDEIADTAIECGLDGIIAVNTTVPTAEMRREVPGLKLVPEGGGLSGAPLKGRSVEVLQRLYARAGDRLTLVSVGGIESAEDVWERIRAGATLVQAHTGFVYGGPLWPHHVNRRLTALVKEAGLESVQQAVGTGVSPSKTRSDSEVARMGASLSGRVA